MIGQMEGFFGDRGRNERLRLPGQNQPQSLMKSANRP